MKLDSVKNAATTVFSNTYLEARQKFLAAVPEAKSYQCSSKGPSGEALFTDAAYFGQSAARKVLVLVSATHGAEGYLGSAAQLLFLEAKFHESLPQNSAVLLIHALNAYGFAWDRRVTAEGCDLNRNFVDFSRPLPQNPGYDDLADYLVPADISPQGVQRAEEAIQAYRAKHGELQFREARTSGQYSRPNGMFFGGTQPSEARVILEKIVADFDLESRENVVILDYHTGLGPYGYGELQCEQPSGQGGYERAIKIFGPSVTSPELGTSSAVRLHGTQDEYWEKILGERHTYVCLEFGTFSPELGRNNMRRDHWLFKYRPEDADSPMGREIRQATKNHFYPNMCDWKEMVLSRSHLVHRQAMDALT